MQLFNSGTKKIKKRSSILLLKLEMVFSCQPCTQCSGAILCNRHDGVLPSVSSILKAAHQIRFSYISLFGMGASGNVHRILPTAFVVILWYGAKREK